MRVRAHTDIKARRYMRVHVGTTLKFTSAVSSTKSAVHKCCVFHEICTWRITKPGAHKICRSSFLKSCAFRNICIALCNLKCLPPNLHFEVHEICISRFTKCCVCHELCAERLTQSAPACHMSVSTPWAEEPSIEHHPRRDPGPSVQ